MTDVPVATNVADFGQCSEHEFLNQIFHGLLGRKRFIETDSRAHHAHLHLVIGQGAFHIAGDHSHVEREQNIVEAVPHALRQVQHIVEHCSGTGAVIQREKGLYPFVQGIGDQTRIHPPAAQLETQDGDAVNRQFQRCNIVHQTNDLVLINVVLAQPEDGFGEESADLSAQRFGFAGVVVAQHIADEIEHGVQVLVGLN
ncbi:hypothetical protein D3C78_1195340 [compost metagenome]